MNANLRIGRNQDEDMGVADGCNCSVYSMATVAGGILLAIGTVIYSVITAM